MFLSRAKECKGDQEWAELVPTYRADAAAVLQIAKLFQGKQHVKAFAAWQKLDSFPRDFFPRRTVKFMRRLAVKELK